MIYCIWRKNEVEDLEYQGNVDADNSDQAIAKAYSRLAAYSVEPLVVDQLFATSFSGSNTIGATNGTQSGIYVPKTLTLTRFIDK